jgi:hypothetical protein
VGGEAVIARDDRQPIIVADAGPLLRLAAAGLLDTVRGLNRRIVLVDRVEDELTGDPAKPFARDIAAWIVAMGDAVLRANTVVGEGIRSLRGRERSPAEDQTLKSALRNSGELALREFVDGWRPAGSASAVVLYEDKRLPGLFMDVDYPVTLMTTRAFTRSIARWGINVDSVAALEKIADLYDLKPALIGEINPETPSDLRQLPKPMADDGAGQ